MASKITRLSPFLTLEPTFTFNSITVNYLNQDETIQEKDEDSTHLRYSLVIFPVT